MSEQQTITAWFVVCVSRDTPDGPGCIIGPFPDREMAEWEADFGCPKAHLVVRGPGSAEASLASANAGWKAVMYWRSHQDGIPTACRAMLDRYLAASCRIPAPSSILFGNEGSSSMRYYWDEGIA